MIEINAQSFLGAATELRRLNTILSTMPDQEATSDIEPDVRRNLADSNARMIEAINLIGARAAGVSAQRLQEGLTASDQVFTIGELQRALLDIEARFADELGFIKLFVIDQARAGLFGGADELLGPPTAALFPSVWFDCEEAAKCLCTGRPTASVFHCMRMLEIAIRALAKRLNIEDPVKPAHRNWGIMLKVIKERMDSTYPPSQRKPASEGALVEKLYFSLDAVKNPWRNETMHVEGVYTEAEAQHILQCVAVLFQTMAQGFDENGQDTEVRQLVG